MSQASLDDDELFGEAATEMRDDVETSLEEAWAALPESEEIWETDANNVLGVLNGLKSALSVGNAKDHLRDAKKWFMIGQRADAFDDADDLEEEIADVESAIEDISDAADQVGDLTATIPTLRGTLESASAADDADDTEAEEVEAEAEEE